MFEERERLCDGIKRETRLLVRLRVVLQEISDQRTEGRLSISHSANSSCQLLHGHFSKPWFSSNCSATASGAVHSSSSSTP